MDKIMIRGLKIFAFHGVNPEEKEKGQTFIVDADLSVSLKRAGKTDDLNNTVNYSKLVKAIIAAMTGEKYDLIEAAAENTVCALFEKFREIFQIDFTLKKPEAPISADFDYVAVSISRTKDDFCLS